MRSRRVALREKWLRLFVEQHVQRVNPDGCPDGKPEQVQKAKNDREDARPLLALEQSDPGDDARERENHEKNGERGADDPEYADPMLVDRDGAKDPEEYESEDHQNHAEDDVEEPEDLDVSVHLLVYPDLRP